MAGGERVCYSVQAEGWVLRDSLFMRRSAQGVCSSLISMHARLLCAVVPDGLEEQRLVRRW